MLTSFLLFGLVFTAVITDLTRHKIYNWITYTGILVALSLNTLGALLQARALLSEEVLRGLGWIPPAESLVGLLLCGFVMLACFVMFKVGGGDVKFMAMLGAFLGPDRGLATILWTFYFGACVGLILLIWRVGIMQMMSLILRRLVSALAPMWVRPLRDDEQDQLHLPLFLAPCVIAGVAVVIFLSPL